MTALNQKTKKRTRYVLAGAAGVFLLRTMRLAYHRSRLERFFESIIGGVSHDIELTKELIESLPKSPHDFRGRLTEPFSLLLIGQESDIRRAFSQAGWQEAVPINASNWAKAFWAGLRDKPYPTGPMTPYYLSTTPQHLSVQKETPTRSIRQRHHARFWRTNLRTNGQPIWLGIASLDISLKLINGLRFPYHHIDADLDRERDYIVNDLEDQGGRLINSYQFSDRLNGKNDHGDKFYTDGQLKAIDLRRI